MVTYPNNTACVDCPCEGCHYANAPFNTTCTVIFMPVFLSDAEITQVYLSNPINIWEAWTHSHDANFSLFKGFLYINQPQPGLSSWRWHHVHMSQPAMPSDAP